jgi:hypothetical protein
VRVRGLCRTLYTRRAGPWPAPAGKPIATVLTPDKFPLILWVLRVKTQIPRLPNVEVHTLPPRDSTDPDDERPLGIYFRGEYDGPGLELVRQTPDLTTFECTHAVLEEAQVRNRRPQEPIPIVPPHKRPDAEAPREGPEVDDESPKPPPRRKYKPEQEQPSAEMRDDGESS